MKGLASLFGGYPDEAELIAAFNSGEPVELDYKFAIYMGVLLVTFASTSFYQFGEGLTEKVKEDMEKQKKV